MMSIPTVSTVRITDPFFSFHTHLARNRVVCLSSSRGSLSSVRVVVHWFVVGNCREYSVHQSVATPGCWAASPHPLVVTIHHDIVCVLTITPKGIGKHPIIIISRKLEALLSTL